MRNLIFRMVAATVVTLFMTVIAVRLSAPLTGSEMIGYLSNRDDVRGQFGIYLHDLRTRREQIAYTTPYMPSTFDFSPSCDSVVFIHSRGRGGDLYLSRFGSSDVEVLATVNSGGYALPKWSPDGRSILLTRYHHSGGNGVDIVLLNPINGAIETLLADLAGGVFVTWIPDGSGFTYTLSGSDAIFVYDMATGDTREIPSGRGSENAIAYSPDGRQIAFTRNYRSASTIYVLNLETGEEQRITDGSFETFFVTWSPDGERIAYSQGFNIFGDFDLYIHDLQTGTSRAITSDTVPNLFPVWAHCP